MRIENFEAVGLGEVVNWLKGKEIEYIPEETGREVLKTVNISFLVENINRLQSTLLCELKDSYVQQSQRYVDMKEDAYYLPQLEKEDKEKAQLLIKEAFSLYNKMSELKEEASGGRPKREDYKHGIPIEDARYILPLAARTNISVAMSGDKLYDLFNLLHNRNYGEVFAEFRKEIKKNLPVGIVALLSAKKSSLSKKELLSDFYSSKFDAVTSENKMVLLDAFTDLDLKVGLGAATSTSASTPSEKLASWGEEAKAKARQLTERVLGYGHESIAEQARTTFGMMCSMVTYHQQIRHRLSKNHREALVDLLTKEREILVPPTVRNSQFVGEFKQLAAEIREFRKGLFSDYTEDKLLPLLLNCEQIKLIISTNARIDSHIMAERICNNAQWEIRKLYTTKLEQLRELTPILYEEALPSCVYKKCSEGDLSCGRQKEMREKWRE